jgi:outer membrane protein OmpA-like peptidoglycan-associated protein
MCVRGFLVIIFLFCCQSSFLFGQQGEQNQKKRKLIKRISPGKNNTLRKEIPPFQFTNLYKLDFYMQEKSLKRLKKLHEQEKWDELLEPLEDYVSKFGILNFSIDSELLWYLGQLYEKKGELEKAKWVYRILLKNIKEDADKVRKVYAKYDSDKKTDYVPIDYYYKLVEYRRQIDTIQPPRGVLLNMGDSINSVHADYGPALNHSDDLLLFTSKRNIMRNMGDEYVNEDIFYSNRKGEDKWTKAKAYEGINSPYNEGSACLSANNNTIYFVRCHAPDGSGNCDIYSAQLKSNGSWGNVKNLGPEVNSEEWDSHPAINLTGDTLFFASGRKGGFGSTDIYFSVKSKNGKWGKAKNLGPRINTIGVEVSPFIHPKFNILYFSSNNQLLNFGNFDIYKSYYFNSNWSEPRNIGPLVNGIGDEFYFTIDSESKLLFYARSEKDNMENLNLYSFPLPMEAQPMAYTNFSGILVDSSGTPLKGMVSVIDLTNGIEVAPKFIKDDGSFDFNLIEDNEYLLVIQGEDFFRIEQAFRLNEDTSFTVQAEKIDKVRIKFESIEFGSNSAKILPEMKADLTKLVDFMLDNPGKKLKIGGHTDSKGNPKHNQELSQDRADAIKKFIVDNGNISPDRIIAIGYGSSKPIIEKETTEEDRRVNRRVEFEIVRK